MSDDPRLQRFAKYTPEGRLTPGYGDHLEIPVGKSHMAKVDQIDYEVLVRHKWHLTKDGYAARNVVRDHGVRRIQMMHRVINLTPHGMMTDHINHDRLDNRRFNLRTVRSKENQRNREAMSRNTSGVRGVSWDWARGKWSAYIKVDYRKIHLGRFSAFADAVEARLKAEMLYD